MSSDQILDLSFDTYGKRLATTSADGYVRIWEGDSSQQWVQRGEGFNPGLGAVWRVAWAHPEFGQLVAVCGAATTASIWEEQEAPDSNGAVISRWQRKAELGDSRSKISDVEFSPRHQGLRLATGSHDALVRIYEVTDLMNVAHWPLTDEFAAFEGAKNSSSSETVDSSPVTCLSWCSSQFDSPMMCLGSSRGEVAVWGVSQSARKWVRLVSLKRHEQGGRVNDVSWAPTVGRSYHLISSAGGGMLCIWQIFSEPQTSTGEDMIDEPQIVTRLNSSPDADPLALVEISTEFSSGVSGKHIKTIFENCEIWRCEWNVSGTSLSSSGEDGVVRVYRADISGSFGINGSFK